VGVVVGLVAAVAVLVLAIHLFSAGESEHARHEVQSQFGTVARVTSCRKVSVDSGDEDEYRCDVTASGCRRSYLFAVDHEFSGYFATPAAKSDRIFARPCNIPSDS
jgi:hypothetical protein